MYSLTESFDASSLKNLSLEELKVYENKIDEKIRDLESNRQEYLSQIQDSLLEIENQFPKLKEFGSFENINQVESMLKTMGTEEYKQQTDKINSLFKQLNPNYEPPKKTAQQIKLSALIETHSSQYRQLLSVITNTKDLLKSIRETITARNLTNNIWINNSSLFNNLLKKYNLPDQTQTSIEKGLRNAACNGNVEDLKQFVKRTKNINARDTNPASGKTALYWAELKCQDKNHPRYSDYMECLRLLKEAGAEQTNLSPTPNQ